jgi:hypothetical protein
MGLFVVRHQHDAARCPAGSPEMGSMLLRHLAAPSAAAHGITIHGEAVVDGAHTLYLILEAPGKENVDRFMQPFGQVGTVEVWPASRCEAVVSRGRC